LHWLGLGSFGTILPLFFAKMTTSAILIGMIPAIHAVGCRSRSSSPPAGSRACANTNRAVLMNDNHERVPYLGLALAAWLLPTFV